MKMINPFLLLLFFFSILSLSRCAPLPNVSEKIQEAPVTPQSPRILSAKGLLSPKQSKALMERLNRSVDPTDMVQRYLALMESVSEHSLTKGNKVTLLIDGPTTYAAMFKAIRNAKDHINLETFIVEDIIVSDETGQRLSDLLLQKQAEGVQVNLLYDSLGSYNTPVPFFQRLRDGGIRVTEFNPVNPLKARRKWRLVQPDHRKVLIVDGKVVFTGGVNISQVYSSRLSGRSEHDKTQIPWRDTDVQIEGPAVAEFQKLFLDTWEKQNEAKLSDRNYFPDLKDEGKTLIGVVSSSPGETNRLTFVLYVSAITFSERSLHMTNAYFVPDQQTVDAFTEAAKCGVDVKIILPAISDSSLSQYAGEYFYSELISSGVELYRRQNVLLHAKTLVIDGIWSTVGSTNMDFWSFSTNEEINAVILSGEFALEMEEMFERDLAESDQIRWEDWEKRSILTRIREQLAHLFARWL